MIRALRSFLFVPFLAAIVLVGCKNSATPARVSGKVTYNGTPVTGGTITFIPVDSNDSYRAGIKADGTYTLNDAAVGEMVVVVETESINPNPVGRPKGIDYQAPGQKDSGATNNQKSMLDMMKKMERAPADAGASVGTYVQIPAKFSEKKSSPLRFTLKAGKQDYDAKLTDD
jgi:hypothetical protein